jgi:protein-S-isoprenylcysteine O-methyltransferase Ste14
MYIARGWRPSHHTGLSSRAGHDRRSFRVGARRGNVAGMTDDRQRASSRFWLSATRVWLPLGIVVAGLVLIVIGHGTYSNLANTHSLESAVGVSLLLVALIVWMLNWMYRLSIQSNEDREIEERAREYFDRTGRWPDEE